MRGMIDRLITGILSAYDDLLTNDIGAVAPPVSQVRALQLMFDLKFIASVLMSFTHDESTTEVSLCSFFLFFTMQATGKDEGWVEEGEEGKGKGESEKRGRERVGEEKKRNERGGMKG